MAKTKRTNQDILAAWNAPGWAGFSAWLADVKPRIRHADNRYKPVVLEPWQVNILKDALETDNQGRLARNLILFVEPRRHAKSTLHALVILWLLTSRQGMTAAALGNHEQHGQRVQMRTLRRIIRSTPALFKLAGGERSLGKQEIVFKATGGLVVQVTPTRASAFGDAFQILWVSDFHAAPDLDAVHALQASLLDSEERLTLIDANTGPAGDHVHALEKEAELDPGMFLHRVEYKDFDDYLEHAPAWISRVEAKRLKRITLPAAFDRDILGKRGSAKNSLFQEAHIQACLDAFKVPVAGDELPALVYGRKVLCGGGLDRALSFSLHGDATIWTVCAKVAGVDGEPEYFILNQQAVPFSSGRGIKKLVMTDHEAFGLENVVFEQYQSADLAAWAQDASIPCERTHATSKDQAAVFTELARIVQEGRLHIPENLPDLTEEMRAFVYELGSTHPKFGAATGHHDDKIYSLAWAIWSLRDQELTTYELSRIVCDSKSPHARLCYLRGGDLQLLCSPDCEAHRRVEAMYLQYTRRRVDHELSLVEFFKAKVRLKGVRVYPGV